MPSVLDAPMVPEPGTPFATAFTLHTQGRSRDDIALTLKASGLDAESVSVALNSLPGTVQPADLPQVRFDQSVNSMSPQLLALLDLGIDGKPFTVALYWLTFGGILSVFLTLVLVIGETELLDSTASPWASFAFHALPWVGYPIAAFALLRAAFLIFKRWL